MRQLSVALLACFVLFACEGPAPAGAQTMQDLPEVREAAERGDAQSQYLLGSVYYIGLDHVPKDPREGVRWLRLAAEQGHARAQSGLGRAYAEGAGVLKDPLEAARWYRMAAEQGDDMAQYSLGGLYEHGDGVRQDRVLAHVWYNIAAVNGDEATTFLAGLGRDRVERRMTRAQINRAAELARACMDSGYRECADD